ncbi:MAG: hypothetical protein AAF224_12595 [Pseudomonadota bacterium]
MATKQSGLRKKRNKRLLLAGFGGASLGLCFAAAGVAMMDVPRLDDNFCWVSPLARFDDRNVLLAAYGRAFDDSHGLTPNLEIEETRVAGCETIDCAIDSAVVLLATADSADGDGGILEAVTADGACPRTSSSGASVESPLDDTIAMGNATGDAANDDATAGDVVDADAVNADTTNTDSGDVAAEDDEAVMLADIITVERFLFEEGPFAASDNDDDDTQVRVILLDEGPGLLIGGFFPSAPLGATPFPGGGPAFGGAPGQAGGGQGDARGDGFNQDGLGQGGGLTDGGNTPPGPSMPTVMIADLDEGSDDPYLDDPLNDDVLVTPLPAAFWLMGPALFGLRAAAQRKR